MLYTFNNSSEYTGLKAGYNNTRNKVNSYIYFSQIMKLERTFPLRIYLFGQLNKGDGV